MSSCRRAFLLSVFVLALFSFSVSAAGSVTRSFETLNVDPGEQIDVTISVVMDGESYYYVREIVPDTWNIISAPGNLEIDGQEITWANGSYPGGVDLTYTVEAPLSGGSYVFDGFYALGNPIEFSIGGDYEVVVLDSTCIDDDGDGWNATAGGECGAIADCDDGDEYAYPGQIWYYDGDGDNYAGNPPTPDEQPLEQCERPTLSVWIPSEWVLGEDCHDAYGFVNPGEEEDCDNGLDDDCNGFCDDSSSSCDDGSTPGDPACDSGCESTCVNPDNDCDGYGDGSDAGCEYPGMDCNDNDPEIGGIFGWQDYDGDGHGGGTPNNYDMCNNPGDDFWPHELDSLEDCDDGDEYEYPGQRWYYDGDGDGYYTDNPPLPGSDIYIEDCEWPGPSLGWRASELVLPGDCHDAFAFVNPAADEGTEFGNTCSDTYDNDCDGYCDYPGSNCGPGLESGDTDCVLCVEDWQCEPWGECVGGTQTRTCTDLNDCGTTVDMPLIERACGDDLIYWMSGEDDPSDGVVLDGSTYGNDASCDAGECPAQVSGVDGNAYDFDGVDDMLNISSSDSMDFDPVANNYTYMFWVNAGDTEASGGGSLPIVAHSCGLGTGGHKFSYDVGLGGYLNYYSCRNHGGYQVPEFYLSEGDSWNQFIIRIKPNPFVPGFYEISVILNGQSRIFHDEVLANPGVADSLLGGFGAGEFANASFDDFRIYDTYLSDSQLDELLVCYDGDGDGWNVSVGINDDKCGAQSDCRDSDPSINPGIAESDDLCFDGLDNDCDGLEDLDDPDCAGFDCVTAEDCTGELRQDCTYWTCQAGNCIEAGNNTYCSDLDGQYCNGEERCTIESGCELSDEPVVCDDGISCTDDTCNEGTDSCDFEANNSNCADGEVCLPEFGGCGELGTCGNGVIEFGEQCDFFGGGGDPSGILMGGENCSSQDYPAGGDLDCYSSSHLMNCTFDYSSCSLLPKYDKFNGTTTNFTDLGFPAIENVFDSLLEINDSGLLNYSGSGLNYTRLDLDEYVIIEPKRIGVDLTGNRMINLNATGYLDFYGINYDNPVILRNGQLCSSDICNITNYTKGKSLKVEVKGFSVYEVAACGDGTCGPGENNGNCPADCPSDPGGGDPPSPGGGNPPGPISDTTKECNDGIDNDNDTFIDYPNDPGCDSQYDDDEMPVNEQLSGPDECVEDWACTAWSECDENNTRTMNCYDQNDCGTENDKPVTVEDCGSPDSGGPRLDIIFASAVTVVSIAGLIVGLTVWLRRRMDTGAVKKDGVVQAATNMVASN